MSSISDISLEQLLDQIDSEVAYDESSKSQPVSIEILSNKKSAFLKVGIHGYIAEIPIKKGKK